MFELGKVYRRRDLHDEYGGQRQGGIVTPTSAPVIFLITGDAGLGFGYHDEARADGSYIYYGEGQSGPMTFVRGNRAIRDHAADGRDLHMFEKVPPAHLRYRGQFVCAGYDVVPDVPDGAGIPRSAIAFHLVPIAGDAADEAQAATDIAGLSLADLRRTALAAPAAVEPSTDAKRTAYRRSAAVRAYVLARAGGTCEGCATAAPFLTATGRPYLEPHHTRRLSDGGPDHPAAVIALCPTCHRRAHYANDASIFNTSLITALTTIEAGA
jgi:5-methylcytosine-specific restriction protein A